MDVGGDNPFRGKLSDHPTAPKRLTGRLTSGLMDDNSWIQNSGNNKRSIKGETVKSVERSSLPGRLKGTDASWITNTTHNRKPVSEDLWLRSSLRTVRSTGASNDSWIFSAGSTGSNARKRYTSPGRLPIKATDAQSWIKSSESKESKGRNPSSESLSEVKARFEHKSRMEPAKDSRSRMEDNTESRGKITGTEVERTSPVEEETMSRRNKSETKQARVKAIKQGVTNMPVHAKEETNRNSHSKNYDNNENGLAPSGEDGAKMDRRRRRMERDPDISNSQDEKDENENLKENNNNNGSDEEQCLDDGNDLAEHKSKVNDEGRCAQLRQWDRDDGVHCLEGQDIDIEFQKVNHVAGDQGEKTEGCGVITEDCPVQQLEHENEIDTSGGKANFKCPEDDKHIKEEEGKNHSKDTLFEKAQLKEDMYHEHGSDIYSNEELKATGGKEIAEYDKEIQESGQKLEYMNYDACHSKAMTIESGGSDFKDNVDQESRVVVATGIELAQSMGPITSKGVPRKLGGLSMNTVGGELETHIHVTKARPEAENGEYREEGDEPSPNEDKCQLHMMDETNNHDSCNQAPEKGTIRNGSPSQVNESKLVSLGEEDSGLPCSTELQSDCITKTGSTLSSIPYDTTSNKCDDITGDSQRSQSANSSDNRHMFHAATGTRRDKSSAIQSGTLESSQESIDSVDSCIPERDDEDTGTVIKSVGGPLPLYLVGDGSNGEDTRLEDSAGNIGSREKEVLPGTVGPGSVFYDQPVTVSKAKIVLATVETTRPTTSEKRLERISLSSDINEDQMASQDKAVNQKQAEGSRVMAAFTEEENLINKDQLGKEGFMESEQRTKDTLPIREGSSEEEPLDNQLQKESNIGQEPTSLELITLTTEKEQSCSEQDFRGSDQEPGSENRPTFCDHLGRHTEDGEPCLTYVKTVQNKEETSIENQEIVGVENDVKPETNISKEPLNECLSEPHVSYESDSSSYKEGKVVCSEDEAGPTEESISEEFKESCNIEMQNASQEEEHVSVQEEQSSNVIKPGYGQHSSNEEKTNYIGENSYSEMETVVSEQQGPTSLKEEETFEGQAILFEEKESISPVQEPLSMKNVQQFSCVENLTANAEEVYSEKKPELDACVSTSMERDFNTSNLARLHPREEDEKQTEDKPCTGQDNERIACDKDGFGPKDVIMIDQDIKDENIVMVSEIDAREVIGDTVTGVVRPSDNEMYEGSLISGGGNSEEKQEWKGLHETGSTEEQEETMPVISKDTSPENVLDENANGREQEEPNDNALEQADLNYGRHLSGQEEHELDEIQILLQESVSTNSENAHESGTSEPEPEPVSEAIYESKAVINLNFSQAALPEVGRSIKGEETKEILALKTELSPTDPMEGDSELFAVDGNVEFDSLKTDENKSEGEVQEELGNEEVIEACVSAKDETTIFRSIESFSGDADTEKFTADRMVNEVDMLMKTNEAGGTITARNTESEAQYNVQTDEASVRLKNDESDRTFKEKKVEGGGKVDIVEQEARHEKVPNQTGKDGREKDEQYAEKVTTENIIVTSASSDSEGKTVDKKATVDETEGDRTREIPKKCANKAVKKSESEKDPSNEKPESGVTKNVDLKSLEEPMTLKVTYDNRYYVPVNYSTLMVSKRYRLSPKPESAMVNGSTDVCWDNLILEVFEESDTIFFPLQTQKEARSFVKALHLKGHSFESMCREIGEHEHNFNSWRKSLGRAGIGNSVMLWANRPLQDLLDESEDEANGVVCSDTDHEVNNVEVERKRQKECQERLQPKVTETASKKTLDFNKNDKKQADLAKESEKNGPTSKVSARESKTASPPPQPKEEKQLKQKYEQEPDLIRLKRLEEFKKERNLSKKEEEDAVRDVRKRISLFENKTSPPKSNSESQEDVSKLNEDEDSKTESESLSSGNQEDEQDSSPETDETGTGTSISDEADLNLELGEKQGEKAKVESEEEELEEEEEKPFQKVPPHEEKKKEEERQEVKVTKTSTSNGHSSKVSASEESQSRDNTETNLPSVDENYNSDLDPENDMQSPMLAAAVKKISATRSNKNWSGFLFVFSDTPGNSDTCRVKVGVSSFPHKRLRQAQLFNPNIYQVKIMAVKQRATAMEDVLNALEAYRMANQKDWFEGPFNDLLAAISGVASRYPSSRKILSQDDDDNEESAC